MSFRWKCDRLNRLKKRRRPFVYIRRHPLNKRIPQTYASVGDFDAVGWSESKETRRMWAYLQGGHGS